MKTIVSGIEKEYKNMLDSINQLDENLSVISYIIGDLLYHGYTKEMRDREYNIYSEISEKVLELKIKLEAISQ